MEKITRNDCLTNIEDHCFQNVLGLRFYKKNLDSLLKKLGLGSFLIAPSAPSILGLREDPYYRESVEAADIAIVDSGLMALCWNITHPSKIIRRISGYRFLDALLKSKRLQTLNSSFWVMASEKDKLSSLRFLNQAHGFHLRNEDAYVAPLYKYGAIKDETLLDILNQKKPDFIILNIGGGTQERLGFYLKKQLKYPATIICTGAALGFMCGRQTYIPHWADRLYLGWLWRCVGNPKVFLPRYIKGLQFIPLFLKFHDKSPDLKVIKK